MGQRCFVNTDWDAAFPNSTLSSRTRFASDHVSLLVSASTQIPRSTCFRFENAWLQRPAFASLMAATLGHHGHTTDGRSFTHLLKLCRRACRTWARRLGPLDQREYDTTVLVEALDLLEEARPLNANEAALWLPRQSRTSTVND